MEDEELLSRFHYCLEFLLGGAFDQQTVRFLLQNQACQTELPENALVVANMFNDRAILFSNSITCNRRVCSQTENGIQRESKKS